MKSLLNKILKILRANTTKKSELQKKRKEQIKKMRAEWNKRQ